MKNLFWLMILVMLFLQVAGQECETKFDFKTFSIQGTPDGSWNVLSSRDVINAAYVYPATFFVSPQQLINVRIKGTLSVESRNDNDFIGIVFGYHKPTHLAENNNYNFYLFDWKKETENFSYQAFEGFRLSHYDGFISMNDQKKYMWGRFDEPPIRNLLEERYGDTLGWESFRKYQFELIYTSNRIRITIDGETVFEREGCFDAGKFGLYCMSQDYTRFEDFTYQYFVDFVPIPESSCLGEPVKFYSFDFGCSEFPDFVESMLWDFGDGKTSTEINPEHIYENDGSYDVSLIVSTTDGCTDTTIKSVTVKPYPNVNLGSDTIVQACSSIILDAGNPGSSYQWSTGAVSQTIEINNISEAINVWVDVNKGGCVSGDSIFIEVEPIQEKLFFPNAFTPDGDGLNELFLPIGVTTDVTAYQLTIFNRWGQQVFETDNPNIGWDGKYIGEPLQTGVFAYKVAYRIERECFGIFDYSEQATLTLLK